MADETSGRVLRSGRAIMSAIPIVPPVVPAVAPVAPAAAAVAAVTTKKVKVAGIEIEILLTSVPITDVRAEPTFKKEERSGTTSGFWSRL